MTTLAKLFAFGPRAEAPPSPVDRRPWAITLEEQAGPLPIGYNADAGRRMRRARSTVSEASTWGEFSIYAHSSVSAQSFERVSSAASVASLSETWPKASWYNADPKTCPMQPPQVRRGMMATASKADLQLTAFEVDQFFDVIRRHRTFGNQMVAAAKRCVAHCLAAPFIQAAASMPTADASLLAYKNWLEAKTQSPSEVLEALASRSNPMFSRAIGESLGEELANHHGPVDCGLAVSNWEQKKTNLSLAARFKDKKEKGRLAHGSTLMLWRPEHFFVAAEANDFSRQLSDESTIDAFKRLLRIYNGAGGYLLVCGLQAASDSTRFHFAQALSAWSSVLPTADGAPVAAWQQDPACPSPIARNMIHAIQDEGLLATTTAPCQRTQLTNGLNWDQLLRSEQDTIELAREKADESWLSFLIQVRLLQFSLGAASDKDWPRLAKIYMLYAETEPAREMLREETEKVAFASDWV